jgi:hypothetical protein
MEFLQPVVMLRGSTRDNAPYRKSGAPGLRQHPSSQERDAAAISGSRALPPLGRALRTAPIEQCRFERGRQAPQR